MLDDLLQLSDWQHVNVRPPVLLGHVGEHVFVIVVTPRAVNFVDFVLKNKKKLKFTFTGKIYLKNIIILTKQ